MDPRLSFKFGGLEISLLNFNFDGFGAIGGGPNLLKSLLDPLGVDRPEFERVGIRDLKGLGAIMAGKLATLKDESSLLIIPTEVKESCKIPCTLLLMFTFFPCALYVVLVAV